MLFQHLFLLIHHFVVFQAFLQFSFFFFDKFSQQNNTKSETGIGDKKLRVEMYLFFLRQMQSMESKEKKYLSCLVSSPGNSGDCLHECVVFRTIFIQGYTKSSKTLYTQKCFTSKFLHQDRLFQELFISIFVKLKNLNDNRNL